MRDLADASRGIKEQDRDSLERNLSQMQPSPRRTSAPLPDCLAQQAGLTPPEGNDLQVEWLHCSIYSTFVFLKEVIYISYLEKHEGQRSFATFKCNYQRMLIPIQK